MSRPNSIRIGATKWDIVWSEKKTKRHPEGNDRVLGLTIHKEQTIYIDDSTKECGQKDTLLHEVLHAIMGVYSFAPSARGKELEREEKLICSMTPALLDTMQRNKKAFAWMMEG